MMPTGALQAVLFAQAGANVVITGRRTGELERVVERAREANREGMACPHSTIKRREQC